MDVKKITYEDKEAIQNDETIAEKNKITANDMNQIKKAINNNADILTEEKNKVDKLNEDNSNNKDDIEKIQEAQKNQDTNIQNLSKIIEANIEKVAQNTKDITANKTKIEENTKAIEVNAENIAKNSESIAKNSKSIEELTAENTALKEELERQREDNKLNGLTEDNEGEMIHIENTTGARFNTLEIFGNEKQDTREGKNLYNVYDTEGRNFNSTLLKIDDEDKISLEDYTNSSDTTKWIDFNTNISQKIKASTVYYVVTEIFSVSGSGNLTVVSTNASILGQFATSVSYNFSALAAGDVKIAQITSREDLSNCVSMLRSFLQFNAGQGGSISFRVSVLEKSVTAEDFKYEKYGESPSFYYPSEVKTVENSINLKICNKNLNDNNYELGTLSSTTGAELASSTTLRSKDYLKIKPNTNYSVILEKISGLNPTSYSFRCYDRQKNFLETIAFDLISSTSKTLNIKNSNVAYVRLLTFNDKDISNYELSIQIEEGAVATDIVAHKEQNYIVPVQQSMFSKDKFDLLNKKEVHNVKKVVLDGEYYVWNVKEIGTSGIVQFGINLEFTTKENPFAISNYFRKAKDFGIVNTFVVSTNRTTAYFHIPKNFITEVSATALQAKLKELYDAGNPVTLWVEAEEPDELDLTDEQIEVLEQIEQATTYKEVTNVYTEDEIGAIIKTNTNVDLKSLINNIQEQLIAE